MHNLYHFAWQGTLLRNKPDSHMLAYITSSNSS